jgi:thymidylate synthase (FAD)
MKVSMKVITPDVEQNIVEIARVSSSRNDKSEKPEGLLNYLIKNKHWSPFEHGSITFEIETSKAIGIQLIRHRSFTFQEFSQRYQDVSKISESGMFEDIELRKQSDNNRQSSSEVFDPYMVLSHEESVDSPASVYIKEHQQATLNLYNTLIEAGVAREQARMVLPMATKTRIYMTGTVRSWIHFLAIRDDEHAQKEIRLIAQEIKAIMVKELPIISKALSWI